MMKQMKALPAVMVLLLCISAMETDAAPAVSGKKTSTAQEDDSIVYNTKPKSLQNKKNNEIMLAINGTVESVLLKDGLFEGDLKLSAEFILKFYNLSSLLNTEREVNTTKELQELLNSSAQRDKRAAIRDRIHLWQDGLIPYRFSNNIPTATRQIIQEAIDHWETHTCLSFVQWRGQKNYLEFDNTNQGCYSDSVGRKGGKQTINLEPIDPVTRSGCEYFGKIVHELGHAIGFWHEQTRPDRDNYVTINKQNVATDELAQFLKRSNTEVDSRGFKYDYGSIMHYGVNAFVRENCEGCQTITIINSLEYANQDRPMLGQEWGLSTIDIMQANRLYSCRSTFYGFLSGRLRIDARYGVGLPDSDDLWNYSDPYLEIIATDRYRSSVRRTTSVDNGTLNPVWNQSVWFDHGEWVQFSVTVYDSDFNADDQLSPTYSFRLLSHGYYAYRKIQANSGFVIFDYGF